MEGVKVFKFSEEGLKDSIAGLTQTKTQMQQMLLNINFEGKGKEDSKELGEHFTTAINAMETLLVYIESENKEESGEVSDEAKEEILKEYSEDLYQEFNQITRCEGKITMKDVADILQLNESAIKNIYPLYEARVQLKGSNISINFESNDLDKLKKNVNMTLVTRYPEYDADINYYGLKQLK
ncbi:hypothetical protein [Clostridium butyricum]